MLSTGKKFDDISLSVTIMPVARIRLARIAFKFTKLQNLNLGYFRDEARCARVSG
jgi:hypothetical protein